MDVDKLRNAFDWLLQVATEEQRENFETAIEAVEKQMPEKVKHYQCFEHGTGYYKCPNCGADKFGLVAYSYCCDCGKALDWE